MNELVAKNIRELREKHGLTQEDFSEKVFVSRPTVSKWEKGDVIPNGEQLITMANLFGTSSDYILGISPKRKNLIIVDSSVLLRRPRIINELDSRKVEFICMTQTILDEVNFQKDKGRRKQQAWLVMKSFNELKEKYPERFLILQDKSAETLNDKRIIDTALRITKDYVNTNIYVLSEDIYFPLNERKNSEIEIINLLKFEQIFSNSDFQYNSQVTSDFYMAIETKNINEAKQLLKKRPDVNAVNGKTGFTPLIASLRKRDVVMLKWLLSLPEIDFDKCDDSKYKLPPLSHAVQIKNKEIFELMIQNGVDIDCCSKGKNSGNTPLMIAAWNGDMDFVKVLVEQGACPNQQDSNGFTALIKACYRGKIDVADYLIPLTDIRIRSREGKTALDFAQEKCPDASDLIFKLMERQKGGNKI